MEDALVRCLDGDALYAFLDLIGPIWESLNDRTIVIHANSGDVLWRLSADGAQWCHDGHDAPSPDLIEISGDR